MITELRCLNLQFYRNASRLIDRRFSLRSGCALKSTTVVCPIATSHHRRLHDLRPDPLKNIRALRARDCSGRAPAPPPEEKSSSNNSTKWLLALLAAAGAGGLAYFFTQGGGESDGSKKAQDAVGTEKIQLRIPASSADLPKHIPYLLIGGGTASFSAFRSIKSHDAKAKVLVISNEYMKPYMRPPLSKELWYSLQTGEVSKDYRFKQWTGSERSLFFEPEEFFEDPTKLLENENGGIAIAQGYSVKKIDAANRKAILDDGTEITYDQCLLATGCTPRNLSVFNAAPKNVKEKVSVFRTPEDFEQLKHIADTKKSITIVGSGFLGSELACALANYGKSRDLKVYQIFHESANLAKILPEYLGKWTTKKLESLGVRVLPKAQVTEATRDHDNLKLTLSNGKTLLTDHVVICVGCEANTEIAPVSGLEVHSDLGGFVVNAELEARRNLFVAGDAACFYDPLLGRRRVEHHDHSVVSGRLAGENMVGKKKPYQHQSMFWSDLGSEIGFEGIGLVDSSLPTVGVFAKPVKAERTETNLSSDAQPEVGKESTKSDKLANTTKSEVPQAKEQEEEDYGRGVIFYLQDKKIVGILLWNIFNRIGLARTIINQNKSYDDMNEVAKLFEIHS